MTPYSFIAFALAFSISLYMIPRWIKRAQKAKLVGKDVHKSGSDSVAEVGGLPVICGFIGGMLMYIAFKVFIHNDLSFMYTLYAAITAVLVATIIGLVDDILGWKIGLRRMHKLFFTFAIALPIIVINAGHSAMNIPLIGVIEFGQLYPLVLIPLAIVFTSNAFNMLGGYNGLEASMGVVILFTMALISYWEGYYWVSVLGMCMVTPLLAFLLFNWYPAKIFPGDTLTYATGSLVGIMAILANLEKFAVVLFSLYILQFFLKARGKMKKESYAKRAKNGGLVLAYPKFYGVEHIVLAVLSRCKKKVMEWHVTVSIVGLQVVLSGLTIFYYLL